MAPDPQSVQLDWISVLDGEVVSLQHRAYLADFGRHIHRLSKDLTAAREGLRHLRAWAAPIEGGVSCRTDCSDGHKTGLPISFGRQHAQLICSTRNAYSIMTASEIKPRTVPATLLIANATITKATRGVIIVKAIVEWLRETRKWLFARGAVQIGS